MTELRKAAIIGGGVIGAGWASRLRLNGVDVAVFDPDPEAPRKLAEVHANAERAYARMTIASLANQGRITFARSIAEAVRDAAFIQESAPERLELKQRLLAEIDAAAAPAALIGSSTSGLLPSALQAQMRHPERLFVAHPFNPVYLLPLVELVGGERTSSATIARAKTLYESIGMKPVHIRKEIEAFVGDRLLEAFWREALWLVHDDIATVEEIDDITRFAFGLRWAQMGTFMTYRIAGGEAGMRHFMAQFGPALKWPWTKLTDVPELDETLLGKIVAQSDAQARGRSIRELERIRDDNLVAILQALRAQDGGKGWGAGETLREYESKLFTRAQSHVAVRALDLSQPLRLVETSVRPEWVDYNDHMTESRYLQVFGDVTDGLYAWLGMDRAYRASGHSFFTVETHIVHLKEAAALEALYGTTQILGADDKRIHVFHRLHRAVDDVPLATGEQMLLHVDTRASRATAMPAAMTERLRPLVAAHAKLPRPAQAGRVMAVKR